MNSKLIFILKFRNKNKYFLTNGTIQKKRRISIKSIMDEMILEDYFHWLINFLLFEFHLIQVQFLLFVLVDDDY